MHLIFDESTRAILQLNKVDMNLAIDFAKKLRLNPYWEEENFLKEQIHLPQATDLELISNLGPIDLQELYQIGISAISSGETGIVVLAGGMATRFGQIVKAELEISPNITFLDAKWRDTQKWIKQTKGLVHFFVMTSFATHGKITNHLSSLVHPSEQLVTTFQQNTGVRFTENGELLRNQDNEPSLYATGHGDFSSTINQSGTLEAFHRAGGRYLLVSNVDNIGATLDPVILGLHIKRNRAITVEVTSKKPGDKGGAPARVNGKTQLIESFRFPKDFNEDLIQVFNTNTLWFNSNILGQDFPLSWFATKKKILGQDCIQHERLIGQLTEFIPTTYVVVPRDGIDSRFLPIKKEEDLLSSSNDIKALLQARDLL